MYIPLPFPKCPSCHRNGKESFHRDCGGALEIEPNSESVHCKKCGHKWNIWDSKYHCTCKHTFNAREVKDAVDNVIKECKFCAEELDLDQKAYWKRRQLTDDSRRLFIEKFFRGLGYVAGVFLEKLVDIVLKIWKPL